MITVTITVKELLQCILYLTLEIGFPTGQDSASFRKKGTAGQAQNLATGQPVKIRDRTQEGTITIFLSKSGTGHGTIITFFYDFLF